MSFSCSEWVPPLSRLALARGEIRTKYYAVSPKSDIFHGFAIVGDAIEFFICSHLRRQWV
jgi:hypothetical protein